MIEGDDVDYTEVLTGMHRHLGDWWKDLRDRNIAKDNLNKGIHPHMWTKDNAKKYKIDWQPVACSAGEVRITLPAVPYLLYPMARQARQRTRGRQSCHNLSALLTKKHTTF